MLVPHPMARIRLPREPLKEALNEFQKMGVASWSLRLSEWQTESEEETSMKGEGHTETPRHGRLEA